MSPLALAVVQRKLSHLAELLELLRGESTTPLNRIGASNCLWSACCT